MKNLIVTILAISTFIFIGTAQADVKPLGFEQARSTIKKILSQVIDTPVRCNSLGGHFPSGENLKLNSDYLLGLGSSVDSKQVFLLNSTTTLIRVFSLDGSYTDLTFTHEMNRVSRMDVVRYFPQNNFVIAQGNCTPIPCNDLLQ